VNRNDGYKSFSELREAFLNYTRAERNGIYVLLVLIFLVGTYKFVRNYYWVPGPSISEEDLNNNVEPTLVAKVKAEISLFEFDPNTVTSEEMLQLGFKEKAIKTFMNYRATGAKFKSIADFERVYSINAKDIQRVGDYIKFEANEKENTKKKPKPKESNFAKPKATPTLFDFDPNTVSENDLQRLGISEKVSRTILKFRSKGKFRKATDLSKIYGLSDTQFGELLPYIKIKTEERAAFKKDFPKRDSSIAGKKRKEYKPRYSEDTVAFKSIDINQATIEEWQRINGIGPTYAKMINKFRGKLGGFYKVEQIGETYGLPDSVFQKIVPFVRESSPPFKIPINLVDTDSLAKHPYIKWKQAQVVINYRDQHGPYKSPEDFIKVKIFTKEKWGRIIPYLDYGESVDTFDHDVH